MPGFPQRGTVLLVFLLSAWLVYVLGRSVLPVVAEDAPTVAFSGDGILIMLGAGFEDVGLHQFSDASTPVDVIKMTKVLSPAIVDSSGLWQRPLWPGERLDLIERRPLGTVLQRSFIPAEGRMLLGIALHRDQMSRDDWQA